MGIGEHAKAALWTGAGVLLFIICLTAGLSLFQTTGDINTKIYALVNTTDKNQQATLKIENNYTVTGAEVIQTIYQIEESNTPIDVEGHRYEPTEDPDDLDVSTIDVSRTYVPKYVRDTQGKLILLKFDAS